MMCYVNELFINLFVIYVDSIKKSSFLQRYFVGWSAPTPELYHKHAKGRGGVRIKVYVP